MIGKFGDVLLALMCTGLVTLNNNQAAPRVQFSKEQPVRVDSIHLFDSSRNRDIPVLLYGSINNETRKPKLVIIMHGHGGRNSEYSFIAKKLVSENFYVASIQYELPGDKPVPINGSVYESLKPKWESAVQSMLFVIASLKKINPLLDTKDLVLIGHSMGGDIVMLFATEHPDITDKVISLDHYHMPVPRTSKPGILSLRASSLIPADDGVIPTAEECDQYGINIILLKRISHGDMTDHGSKAKKQNINKYITQFINGNQQ